MFAVTTFECVGSPTTLAPHGSAAADRDRFPVIASPRGIAAVCVVIDNCWTFADGSSPGGVGLARGRGIWGVHVFFLLPVHLLCDYFGGSEA